MEAFSMRKHLVLSLLLVASILGARVDQAVAAADPGGRYADAFILIQEAEAAEQKSDYASAYQRYSAALDALRSIRTETPDWKTQMVEYRLKDLTARLEAIKAKAPEAATATAMPVAPPAVEAPPTPAAPVPLPVAEKP